MSLPDALRSLALALGERLASASPAWVFLAMTGVAGVGAAGVTALTGHGARHPVPSDAGPSVTVVEKSRGDAPAPGATRGDPGLSREWDAARDRLREGLAAIRPQAPAAPDARVEPGPPPQGQAAAPPNPAPGQPPASWTSYPQPEMREKAEALLAKGDVTSARLWLASAADKGDAEAAFRLAETYDPVMLGEWGVVGMTSDKARARALYERALSGGVDEARERISRLGR